MPCHTSQPYAVKWKVVTDTPPVYHKEDSDCVDEEHEREWGRPCYLKREVKTPGVYRLEYSDQYIVYVSEQVARMLYYGPKGPTKDELDAFGDDEKDKVYDKVQIFQKPSLRHDACGFIDADGPDDSKTGEPEIIPFLSDLVNNAEEFLNLEGIGPPVLDDLGVRVVILTDDMAEQLKGVEADDEEGLFVQAL